MAKNKHGFTLIELLIVIAIIAILALIAIPNFLEAQTRSKVARVKADLRTISLAYNAYFIDYNNVPPDCNDNIQLYWPTNGYTWDQENPGKAYDFSLPTGVAWTAINVYYHYCFDIPLTSPVAYITSVPRDPFSKYMPFAYDTRGYNPCSYCQRSSIGPDRVAGQWLRSTSGTGYAIVYDPSNGTISSGDITRAMVVQDPTLFRIEYPYTENW